MRAAAFLAGLALLVAAACRERVTNVPRSSNDDQAAEPGPAGRDSGESGDAVADGGRSADGGAPMTAAGSPAGGRQERPPLVTCARALPDTCEARGDSSRGLRLRGTLLAPSQTLVGGELDVDDTGNISCAACDCGDDGGALVLSCPDWVIAPGFINLHDHLGYAGTPPLAHPGELYEHRNDWRLGEHGHAALPFKGSATTAQILAQELRQVMAGTTSIVGSGGKRGFLRNLELPELTEGLLPGTIDAETFPLDDTRGGGDSSACEFGATPDTPAIAARFSAYVAHVGEGTNPRARDELRCALGKLALLGESSAVVHALALTRSDAKKLAERGVSVIWSPRSNLDLYGRTAPVALLSSLGVHVALGTDWLASGSMSLLRELACARHYDQAVLGGYFDDFQLLQMVTSHAAWALGVERRLGDLRAGSTGDVAVFAQRGDAYASVVGAQPADVRLVLRGGTPLYGAAESVRAFHDGEACEELEVCGAAKRVCTLETGLSLSQLRAAGEAVYPLFACESPPDEPSCEATVDRECPVDEERCAEPPDAPAFAARDSDGDGAPDVNDACPRVADDAHDDDGDGRGDACDGCALANPGLLPCPLRISELRAPATRLSRGSSVRLSGARVTALRREGSKGFYLEDGDHADYSGIFVYTGSATPLVELGELVSVQGYFDSFEGTDELVDVEVLARAAPAEDYAPRGVEPAEAGNASAALQSLWLRLEQVEVTATNPDAPRDYDETGLTSGLRLDDLLYSALDNVFPVGTRFRALQGIFGASFGHSKLYPRSADDLTTE